MALTPTEALIKSIANLQRVVISDAPKIKHIEITKRNKWARPSGTGINLHLEDGTILVVTVFHQTHQSE